MWANGMLVEGTVIDGAHSSFRVMEGKFQNLHLVGFGRKTEVDGKEITVTSSFFKDGQATGCTLIQNYGLGNSKREILEFSENSVVMRYVTYSTGRTLVSWVNTHTEYHSLIKTRPEVEKYSWLVHQQKRTHHALLVV